MKKKSKKVQNTGRVQYYRIYKNFTARINVTNIYNEILNTQGINRMLKYDKKCGICNIM